MKTRDSILVVDDIEVNRAILCGLFEDEYQMLEAQNGLEALELIDRHEDEIAVILLDIVMPEMDGYQVLQVLSERKTLQKIPVVVITSDASSESEMNAFDFGASDIVTKPFDPRLVLRRVKNVIELYRHKLHLEDMVAEQAAQLRESSEVLTDALSSVIEYRSLESGQHIRRIRLFTKILMTNVVETCPEYHYDAHAIDVIASASSMHDIGKISIPDSILNKPGRLTPEEFEIMKTHAVRGCELLGELDRVNDKEYLRYAYYICRCHHERWDGSGYPDGLSGGEIPVFAHVVGIADCYDALTTNRVYKAAYSHAQAVRMILGGECGAFSPTLLACFENVSDQFEALARDYADGRLPAAAGSRAGAPELPQPAREPLWGEKYRALMDLWDCTVLDIDLCSGVFQPDGVPQDDFAAFAGGGKLAAALEAFAAALHPADAERFARDAADHRLRLKAGSVPPGGADYRVLSRRRGGYRWRRASLLLPEPAGRPLTRALLVWQDAPAARSGQWDAPDLPAAAVRLSIDKPLRLIEYNDRFLDLAGHTRDSLAACGGNLWGLIDPRDRDTVWNAVRQNLCAGRRHRFVYRLTRRDGTTAWVLDVGAARITQDGKGSYESVLIDITPERGELEEMRLSLERYKIILGQTNDIAFEWDIARDRFSFASNWELKFGYEPLREHALERVLTDSHIRPEDRPAFAAMLEAIRGGTPYREAELRVKTTAVSYIWCRFRMTAQFDEAGRVRGAVGVVIDIDREKRETQQLLEQARLDALTHLYNKGTAHRMIEEYLDSRPQDCGAALLIIDIDDFKLVNDTRGHLFGDAFLVEIARAIQKQFRPVDVVGRVGGDEFVVLLRDIPDRQIALQKAQSVLAAFGEVAGKVGAGRAVSCSIGVATVPEGGESFNEVYRAADTALYHAKAAGKNRYVLYEGGPFGGVATARADVSSGTAIDSDQTAGAHAGHISEYIFRALYRSVDFEAAVASILELVGRQFAVSRAYIFENDDSNAACSCTFEWCGEGIAPARESMQDLSFEGDYRGYAGNFNEEGVFYCQDTQILPPAQRRIAERGGVKSLLQCAVYDRGVLRGFVGFDECRIHRFWTQEQIDALSFIAEILGIFLLKLRAQQRQAENAEALRAILDNQNAWIYVVRPANRELLFINRKAELLSPRARLGGRCYSAFFEREEPCPTCPADTVAPGGPSYTRTLYNPMAKAWTLADACPITWQGEGALLICCRDLTDCRPEGGGE